MLSDNELIQIFNLFKRADSVQLVALNGLVQSMIEIVIKDEQEKLALLISKEEKA